MSFPRLSVLDLAPVSDGTNFTGQKIEKLVERTGADEIMVNTVVFEQSEKLRSYRLLSELMDK